jgi:hypothetical protein
MPPASRPRTATTTLAGLSDAPGREVPVQVATAAATGLAPVGRTRPAAARPVAARPAAARPSPLTSGRAAEAGMATAEYAIATLAACGFAGLLVTILRSGEVRGLLLGVIRDALSVG